MNKFISLFLVLSFLVMGCATYKRGAGIGLEPDQKPGSELTVSKKDGHSINGELIAIKNSSLLLLSKSGTDVSVDVGDVRNIIIKKKQKILLGALGGALAGIGLGIAYNEIYWGAEYHFVPMAISSGIGGLIGIGVSGLFMKDKIRIEGKSEVEIKEILEDLRSKARVRDFQ